MCRKSEYFYPNCAKKKNLTQEELGEQIGVTIKLFPVGKTGTIYRPLKFFKKKKKSMMLA